MMLRATIGTKTRMNGGRRIPRRSRGHSTRKIPTHSSHKLCQAVVCKCCLLH